MFRQYWPAWHDWGPHVVTPVLLDPDVDPLVPPDEELLELPSSEHAIKRIGAANATTLNMRGKEIIEFLRNARAVRRSCAGGKGVRIRRSVANERAPAARVVRALAATDTPQPLLETTKSNVSANLCTTSRLVMGQWFGAEQTASNKWDASGRRGHRPLTPRTIPYPLSKWLRSDLPNAVAWAAKHFAWTFEKESNG
jgi:hypothetical protein